MGRSVTLELEFDTVNPPSIDPIEIERGDRNQAFSAERGRTRLLLPYKDVPAHKHQFPTNGTRSVHRSLVDDVEFVKRDVQVRDGGWEIVRVWISIEISVSEILVVREVGITL